MLIVRRSRGQSLIVGGEYEITLSRANQTTAFVTISETALPSTSKTLSLRLGDSVEVSKTIRITIVDLDRGIVRFGLQVPSDMPVYRKECLPSVDGT